MERLTPLGARSPARVRRAGADLAKMSIVMSAIRYGAAISSGGAGSMPRAASASRNVSVPPKMTWRSRSADPPAAQDHGGDR